MADVAEIGFRADTSALTQAVQALDKLGPAASKAEAATERVDAALDKVGPSATSAAAGLQKTETALEAEARAAQQATTALQQHANAAATSMNKVTKAANDNSGAVRANTANVTAQFQDIAVTAAGGMNPLMIALQQGTQLASVLQTMDKPIQGLADGFKMLLGVVPMLTIGIIALVAAGLQFVNWTKVAQISLNWIADILPKIANYAALAGLALAAAFAPQIASAIWAISTAITRGVIAALVMLVSTVGIIPLAFAAAVAGAVVFHNEISKLVGVDLAGNVKKGANYIVASFMAAYEDIKLVWKNFPAIIGAAAVGAANLNIRAINMMIQAATDGINTLIQGANKLLSLGGIGDKLGIGQIGELSAPKLPELNNNFTASLSEGFKDREEIIAKQFEKDWIGGISKGITKAAKTASGMIKKFAAGLGKKDGEGGDGDEEDAFERIVRNAEARIAKMQAERDALSLTAEAAARLKYETDLLNQAKKADIELTDEQRTKLMGLAAQMATTEIETKNLKDALSFGKDLAGGFLKDFLNGIKNGESVFKSFGNAAMNVLNKISDKLIDMAVNSIFSTGGTGTGFFGTVGKFIGSLFGGGSALGDAFTGAGKVSRFAKGGAFTNGLYSRPTLFQYANGGAFGVMGEAGPEAVMPLKRGPDGSLGVQMHGGNGAAQSGPVSNTVDVTNVYQISGAVSSADIIAMTRQAAEQTKNEVKKNLVPWLNQYNADGVLV